MILRVLGGKIATGGFLLFTTPILMLLKQTNKQKKKKKKKLPTMSTLSNWAIGILPLQNLEDNIF